MKTDTKLKILKIIKENKQVRPYDFLNLLEISSVAIHKMLKKLLEEGKIVKVGTPPLVFYKLAEQKVSSAEVQLPDSIIKKIEQTYLYVTPTGEFLTGINGFKTWVDKIKENDKFEFLAKEYVKTRGDIDRFFNDNSLIDSTDKFKKTFKACFLNKVFVSDFYALPKYGKSLLGNYLIYAKQAQSRTLIKKLASELKPKIEMLIERFKIDGIGFVPHSIPRTVQFLKEFSKLLQINIPVINIVKSYSGSVPIAQKTLAKLEERIENAEKTIFIKDLKIDCHNILLIDDAIGSGATLNETAKKLKLQSKNIKNIIAYAVVGSFKGFDVIREV